MERGEVTWSWASFFFGFSAGVVAAGVLIFALSWWYPEELD